MGKRSERLKSLLFPEQWNARSCTLWWIIVSSPVLFLTAFLSGNTTLYNALERGGEVLRDPRGFKSVFTLTQWLVLVTPALTLLTAWLAHHYDPTPQVGGQKMPSSRSGGGESKTLSCGSRGMNGITSTPVSSRPP